MGSSVAYIAKEKLLVVPVLATELADLAVGTLPRIRPRMFGLLL
jgi:hypothetical protein